MRVEGARPALATMPAAIGVLAVCATCLAIQNTLLLAAWIWSDARAAGVLKLLARGAAIVSAPETELIVSAALLVCALGCVCAALAAKRLLAVAAGRKEAHRG